jgi:hypothetical protein
VRLRLRETEEYRNLENAIAALRIKERDQNIEDGVWPEGYAADTYLSEWAVVTCWANLGADSGHVVGQYVTFESDVLPHRSKGLYAEAIGLIEEEQQQACTCEEDGE